LATSTTIASGGSQYVVGVAVDTTIDKGGVQALGVAGTASATTISGGGTQIVEIGDIAVATRILRGGTQFVSTFAHDIGAQISGGTEFEAGFANGETIFSGGVQIIESRGALAASASMLAERK
jgi:autotransporter passenger strand-loop-strand repeat protein